MIYDYRTATAEISSDDGDPMHQDHYCAEEHCDLGDGDCRACASTRAGYRVCGYCRFLVLTSDLGKPCNAEEQAEDEQAEPEEEDLVTEDYRTVYADGKLVLRTTPDRFERDVKRYMKRTQFWPNVWFISDHGNAHRVDLS